MTPGTVARQAHPSAGFSRQEYCSGLLFPSKDGAVSVCLNIFGGQLLHVDTLLTSASASKGDGVGRPWLGPEYRLRLLCALHVRSTLHYPTEGVYVVAGSLSASKCKVTQQAGSLGQRE